MKILVCPSVLHRLFNAVARHLAEEEPSYRFAAVVFGADQVASLRESQFPGDDVRALTVYLRDHLAGYDPDPGLLVDWEEEHQVSLSLILAADRRITRLPRPEQHRVAALCIQWLEEALDAVRPDVIVAEGIDCLVSYLLYVMARRRGIPFLICGGITIPGRHAIYGNPQNRWEKLESIYGERKVSGLMAAQRSRAEQLRQAYTERQVVPDYMKIGMERVFGGVADLKKLSGVVHAARVDPVHRYNPDYQGTVSQLMLRKLARVSRQLATRRGFFAQPVDGERFVFFPLQVEPECTTLVLAPHYANQLFVVEALAKSLPIDHLLYVKDHPLMAGRRPLGYYKRMKAMPNVRLLDAGVSSKLLIQNASALAVITSSVGWEAIVHEKPVVVLGNVWYADSELVYKARSLTELPALLKAAINGFRPDRELLLQFMSSVLDATYDGYTNHPDYDPGVLAPHNVRALARGVQEHLGYLRQTGALAAPAAAGSSPAAVQPSHS